MSDSLHLVCPHCLAANRVPATRLVQGPRCGRCHRALFDGHPAESNTAAFEQHIKRNDIPVLVDFWAPWCGPCRMMAPQFAQAASLLEPKVRLVKVNTEEETLLSGKLGIRSIPTLVLFQAGREIARQAGAMGGQAIVRWTLSHLGA